MKPWFRMEVSQEEPTVAEIYFYEVIGGWVEDMYRAYGYDLGDKSAKTFLQELSTIPDSVKTLRLHINSPGGDVFSAVAIVNTLREQKASKGRTVEVVIEGLAASAASIIAMAGDTIQMADTALMMIHLPWTWSVGNQKDFAKVIEELDKVTNAGIVAYRWHSTLSNDEIRALLEAETWMDADEAIASGFATAKVEGLRAAAKLDRRGVEQLAVPDKFKARVNELLAPAPAAAAPIDVMRLCREGGCPELAEGLVAAGATSDQVTAKLTEAKTAKAAAATRATEIRSICQVAKVPEMAAGYINSAMALDDVRKHVATFAAMLDERAAINGGLPADARTEHGWKNAFARLKRGGLTAQ